MSKKKFNLKYWPENRLEHQSQFFTLEERDRRWNRMREGMSRNGIDCIISTDAPMHNELSGAARYICNGFGVDVSNVVFPANGNPVIFPWVEALNLIAERIVFPGVDVKFNSTSVPTWGVAQQVKEFGYEKGIIGVVGLSDYGFMEGWVPHTTFSLLKRFLPEATFVDATSLMSDIKAIKSEEEIRLFEKAAAVSDRAVEKMVEYLRPGVMEQEVWAQIMYTIISAGCDFSFHGSTHLMHIGRDWYQGGPLAMQHMIQEGDVCLTEFYPKVAGYSAHPHQPVFIGKVHDDYERANEVLSESLRQGLSALTPDHTWMEVGEAFAKPVREAGMTGIQLALHGLSQTFPDPPFVPMPGCEPEGVQTADPRALHEKMPELKDFNERREEYLNSRVQPNMVLGIEPRAIKGKRGLHMGPTVLTTDGYPRILTKYGREVLRV